MTTDQKVQGQKQNGTQQSTRDGTPTWVRQGMKINREPIDLWYKPEEHGNLEGLVLWHGDLSSQGEAFRATGVRGTDGKVYGVRQKAALDLRKVRVGSRLFIKYKGQKDLGLNPDNTPKRMHDFDIFADKVEEDDQPAPFQNQF